MYLNLKNQIKDKQIYSGSINARDMLEHLLCQNKFLCSNGQLSMYCEIEGRWIGIDEQNEWHVIGCFFTLEIRRAIKTSTIKEIIQRMKYTAEIQVDVNEFNKHDELINVRNGVLDYKSKKLLPKDPKYMFTYQLNVAYVEGATKDDIPYLLRFYQTSLDEDGEKLDLLLQIIGYLCTTLMTAKKCFILVGEPNSGKSLILHLIEYMIGKKYISNIPLEKLGNRFSSAVLSDKLLNACAELSAQALKDIEIFKLIVGGDTLYGEFKGKPLFQFKNRCKLLFAGNMLPPIKSEDTSTAFIDRLTVLRFSHSIPKENRIYDLGSKLQSEADAIFTLSINALRALVDDNFTFILPDDSKELLAEYSFQLTNIDAFANECCEYGEKLNVHSVKLYKAYKQFCAENAAKPISQNLFSQRICSIKDVSGGKFRVNGSKPLRGFYGISLKNEYLQDSEG